MTIRPMTVFLAVSALLAAIPPIIHSVMVGEYLLTAILFVPAMFLVRWTYTALMSPKDGGGYFALDRDTTNAAIPVFTCLSLFFLYGIFTNNDPAAYVYFTSMTGWVGYMSGIHYLLKPRRRMKEEVK